MLMNTPENLISDFFNLLALIKYVIENKASVPFEKEGTNSPFMKAVGFEPYFDLQDRIMFGSKTEEKKSEIKQDVKKYHYFRRKSEEITRSLVVLYGGKGGEITLPFKVCNYIRKVLEWDGVIITSEFLRKFPKKLDGEVVTEWGDVYKIVFDYVGCSFEVEAFLYNIKPLNEDSRSEGDPFIISFIEDSIKDVSDGESCLALITTTVDQIVRNIDLEDCF